MKNKLRINITGLVLLLITSIAGVSCNGSSGGRGMFAGLFGGGGDIEEFDLALSVELSDSLRMMQNIKALELPEKLKDEFREFYQDRNFKTAWVKNKGVNDAAEELLAAIARADEDGLNSEDYKLQYLHHAAKKIEKDKNSDVAEVIKLDKELTATYLKFASHKLQGRVNPQELDALWKANPRQKDLSAHLEKALQQGEIKESLKELEPAAPQYTALKEAYKNYKLLLEEKGEWPKLPSELLIKAGDSSKYVGTLRARLKADGFFKSPRPDSLLHIYDSTLVKAVMVYQQKNGLEPDGVVGGETLNMLNTTLKHRINQIQLNLERMRWSSERPNGRYLLVNVPQYMLYVYDGGRKTMEMRVIVGEAYKSGTPLFSDTMEYIAFSPTWTVPNSIATEEILPKLQKDPGYLGSNHFKIYEGWDENAAELNPYKINWNRVSADNFPYRIVQQPGDHNALGHVKFMFPNELDIYLHDTPADYLFKKAERDFSHGCIRVERPVDLAHYLLDDSGWSKEKIQTSMKLDHPENVPLKKKLPVILDYRTVWIDDDGHMSFAKDIYGHDQKQMQRFNDLLAVK